MKLGTCATLHFERTAQLDLALKRRDRRSAQSIAFVGTGIARLTLNADQSYRFILNRSGRATPTISGLRLIYVRAGIGSAAFCRSACSAVSSGSHTTFSSATGLAAV